MPGGLEGKHAVVTGGGRGIGAAIATTLAGDGAALTLMGRDEARLADQAGKLERARAVALDLTDAESIERAFAEAVDGFGPVSVLVNNAGVVETAPFTRSTVEQWNRMIDVNVLGTMLCTKAVLPAMVEAGWGRVVNIASVAGLKGYAYVAGYCATKHAVVGMTRALAAETARQGVTVNAVCPGYTDTDMVREGIRNIMDKTGRSEKEACAELVKHNPQGRLIEPNEVAATVAWLCLPGSESVTGQAIAIAGGEVP